MSRGEDRPATVDTTDIAGIDERTLLLLTHAGIMEHLALVRSDLDSTAPESVPDLFDAEVLIAAAAEKVRDGYRALVPVVPVSRSPISGEIVEHSLDFFGIDGWWWDFESPIRPTEPLPNDLVAFTGALALGGELEDTAFFVQPGPAVPFVIPEILSQDGVQAVVSSQAIGNHFGYLILYFAADYPSDGPRTNDWGSRRSTQVVADGSLMWGEEFHLELDYDFELGPWLESESLLWIEPGDEELSLRHGIAGCPYLGLAGVREVQLIKSGEVTVSARPPR